MSAAQTLFQTDLVWEAVQQHLRGTRTSPRTTKFNCPVCVARGYTPDTRFRGGLGYDYRGLGISCMNCGFKTRFSVGMPLGNNIKLFLSNIGVSSQEIARLNHWAATMRQLVEDRPTDDARPPAMLGFNRIQLPEGARTLEEWVLDDCQDTDFLEAVAYIYGRGEEIAEAITYYWTPLTKNDLNRRIIIPCHYGDTLVGWIGRSISKDVTPRYHNATPPNFLFNSAALETEKRNVTIIVEGVLDAIAIDGTALLGSKLSDGQAAWINNSGKSIIVLPDRDKDGSRMIDLAMMHGWSISMPRMMSTNGRHQWWEFRIKDAADAVKKYGKLYTLRSIIECATDNPMHLRSSKRTF